MNGSQKSRRNKFSLALVPLLLFAVLAILFSLDVIAKLQVNKYEILPSPLEYSVKEYPALDINSFPSLSAKGVTVMDRNSKVVIFSKNPDLRFAPASTTKIMTALVGIDYYKEDDILLINKDSQRDDVVDFKRGERVRFVDMLYAMMLPSSNDAASVIADNYPGGEKAFVEKMNEKAYFLSLKNTHYEEPVGLLDTKNYTSTRDLALLASNAMGNELFARVVGTRDKLIEDADKTNLHVLRNLNRLLDLGGINGIKTGYTEEAGQILVTSKTLESSQGPQSLILVVMQSEDRFYDTEVLLRSLEKINYLSIHP